MEFSSGQGRCVTELCPRLPRQVRLQKGGTLSTNGWRAQMLFGPYVSFTNELLHLKIRRLHSNTEFLLQYWDFWLYLTSILMRQFLGRAEESLPL